MLSPFDTKNRVASALDALALRTALLAGCVLYFYWLWRAGPESLAAGLGLFILLSLGLGLMERRTLARRNLLLRQRLGGVILLDDLLLLPNHEASVRICTLLCEALGAKAESACVMRFENEQWLVRCVQCMQGSAASEGDVLAAHRARLEAGTDRCILVSTGGISPAARRAGEWVDPPVRILSGRQLASIAGRLHPATDAEIARHAQLRRTPFSWQRIRSLALSPAKLPRYLACAFSLLLLWLFMHSAAALFSCLLAFFLALLCHAENQKSFRL